MYIETERLIIRSIETTDEQAYTEMASDGSLHDILGDCDVCQKRIASWVREAQTLDRENRPDREYLAYAVTDRQSGNLLGSVGCSYYEDLCQTGLCCFMGALYRGKGYAAEAAAAYTAYLLSHYDIPRIIATVRDDNTAAWKTVEKIGFTLTEIKMYRDIHFGNFLFAEGVFSGYIDFDLSQRNIRIFDICYFMLGLLSRQENLKIAQGEWMLFLRNVIRGYEKEARLSPAEKRAVPYVMECIELLFVAYFEETGDSTCADDAFDIFLFIKARENAILNYIA